MDNLTIEEKGMLGLLAFALFVLAALAWNAPDHKTAVESPAAITESVQPASKPKTWKEPGSARDTFNENFSR